MLSITFGATIFEYGEERILVFVPLRMDGV